MNWRISFEKDTMPRCAALILGSAVLAFRKKHPIFIICLSAALGIAAGYLLPLGI